MLRSAARDLSLPTVTDVVAIKPGYRFENGEITDQRAVVIAVNRKLELGALESRGRTKLPDYIDGVRTDVTVASAQDLFGIDMDEAATAELAYELQAARRPAAEPVARSTANSSSIPDLTRAGRSSVHSWRRPASRWSLPCTISARRMSPMAC